MSVIHNLHHNFGFRQTKVSVVNIGKVSKLRGPLTLFTYVYVHLVSSTVFSMKFVTQIQFSLLSFGKRYTDVSFPLYKKSRP